MGRMPRIVSVVPHTHWDREWYSPFQTFRLRLVDLLDDLLPMLERDPSYAHFLLDGQMAVVDDYVAIRPDAAETLRRLSASGRVAMGPWYTLPDEFLVSGETLVRNLQLGLRKATAFGGAMDVGYLPDMFGHVAQMPQLLRLFGFDHAVVWRGVPSAIDRSGFWWRAPDGSTVRAEYLPQGYGNGAHLPNDAKALARAIDDFVTEHGDLVVGPVLWMNGTDHLMPQPWLGRVVAEVNAIQDDYELVVRGLAEHVRDAPTDDLPTWEGELRSGARANLLMGVASNRVDVKVAAAVAERALERLAEPLSALHLPPERWPAALLDEAWLGVIRNAAHDSVCACSVDEVCDAVLHRYAEAASIGEGLATRAASALGHNVAHDGPVVVNPSARTRSGLVEVKLDGDEAQPGEQLLWSRPAESILSEFPSATDAAVIVQQLEWAPSIKAFAIESEGGDVLVEAERHATGTLITPAVRIALRELDHASPVRVRIRQRPRRGVLVQAAHVDGFGWQGWSPETASAAVQPVVVGDDGRSLSNGLVSLEVDSADGTFAVDGARGLGRLVDDGDIGDTYNWCPPGSDTIVDVPEHVDVSVVEAGPLRARVLVRTRLAVPARIEGDARVGEATLDVETTLELRAGEHFVRVELALDNHVRDHRLRTWFPLVSPSTTSRAECAFDVVERGTEAEGGPTELPMPTYPSRRFVQAGGVTVAHEGLLEYELVDIADGAAGALAVTLVRSTGLLSQGPMTTRPLPAGPIIAVEGAQVQKRLRLRYAVAVGDEIDPYALADDAFVPLLVTVGGAAGGFLPPSGAALTVAGAEVSAVVRDAGQLQVRVFNPSDQPTTVVIEGCHGWLVDLRGAPIEPFHESFGLRPHGIATAQLAG
jgi:alpha-mannosidase